VGSSMKPSHSCLRSAFFAFATAALLVVNLDTRLCGTTALGQTVFDPPEVRTTADVVPSALMAGPHYRVDPTVRTFTFMNQYSVTSDYGIFAAPSDARLRRLVREIAAIAELQKIHQSDAFAKATVEAGKGVIQGAQQLIENPVATIGAVPEAVFSIFRPGLRGGKARRQKQIRRRGRRIGSSAPKAAIRATCERAGKFDPRGMPTLAMPPAS
jgi:hypothetical protein